MQINEMNWPGVRLDRGGADPFLSGRGSVPSLSLRESGVRVPPEKEDLPVLRPMGTLRALLSRTYNSPTVHHYGSMVRKQHNQYIFHLFSL